MAFTVFPATKPAFSTPDERDLQQSFQKSIRFVIILAQCFGQMPVSGVNENNARGIHFTWKSWRVLYTLLCCLGMGFVSSVRLYKLLKQGADIFIISEVFVETLCNR